MKISIYNGSPKGLNSNSQSIINLILKNITKETKVYQLKDYKCHKEILDSSLDSECLLLIFPLYTDAMPGLVMAFIELLENYKKELNNKKIYFIIHSGFPESKQSFYVRDYLIELTRKLSLDLVDVIISGGGSDKTIEFEHLSKCINDFKPLSKDIRDQMLYPVSFDHSNLNEAIKLLDEFNQYMTATINDNSLSKKSFDKPYLRS